MVSVIPEVGTAGSSLRKSLTVGEWCMKNKEEGRAVSSWHVLMCQRTL